MLFNGNEGPNVRYIIFDGILYNITKNIHFYGMHYIQCTSREIEIFHIQDFMLKPFRNKMRKLA